MQKHDLLQRHFGHTEFRPGQAELIDAILSGRDALGVMPTGAGKSMCYQIPALMLPGVTLVVSPLISLMKDQVAALTQAGVKAAYINSSLTAAQYREVFRRLESGSYKIVYIAPERLMTQDFLDFAQSTDIPLVAVDEAHCVSHWGQDFRPSYLKIAEFIGALPHRPVLAAFTATATDEVKDDIARMLELQEPLRVTTGFDRPNLYFEVARPRKKLPYLLDYLTRNNDKSGIVYCATRKLVDSVCASLIDEKIPAARYHAGLSDDERRRNQDAFVRDEARVMVATNAFGMGIDKSNVSFVVHYNMPKNLESYYQEAGRAGRDGESADCILLYSAGDVQTAKFLIQNSEENEEMTEDEREAAYQRDLERLERMTSYCKTTACLRTYILAYFGEQVGDCGNCGNCRAEYVSEDITTDAQKILSAVARVERKFSYGLGAAVIIRMLHGGKDQRIKQLGLDEMQTYGAMKTTDRRRIRECVDYLVSAGYLEQTRGEYPVLRLGTLAGGVLFRGERVEMPVLRRAEPEIKTKSRAQRDAAPSPDDGLLGALRALRTRLATEANVPAYIVFSNATLSDIAAKRPRTMAEFMQVSGVGEVKAERYGEAFLTEIEEYLG